MREAPALKRIQTEFKDRNLQVVAINLFRHVSLETWEEYWRGVGGGDVLYASDTERQAILAFNVRTPGATVVVNRNGEVVFQDGYATDYETLLQAVLKALI